jgi:hypothetical protein
MSKKEAAKVLTKFRKTNIRLDDDRATHWLARNLSKIKSQMRPYAFIDSSKTITKRSEMTPGRMVFYGYDPKTKDSLDFWDDFPIVVILHPKPKGFLGLNLHYIPPDMRAHFLNNLIDYVDDPNWDVYNNYKALIKVTYPILKHTRKMYPFKNCIKRYLFNHIVSDIAFIPSVEWKSVPFFPLDQFQGATREDVWRLAR